jgi:hypothetical protein
MHWSDPALEIRDTLNERVGLDMRHADYQILVMTVGRNLLYREYEYSTL